MDDSASPRAGEDREGGEDDAQLAVMLRKCRMLDMTLADDKMPMDDEVEVRHILPALH